MNERVNKRQAANNSPTVIIAIKLSESLNSSISGMARIAIANKMTELILNSFFIGYVFDEDCISDFDFSIFLT